MTDSNEPSADPAARASCTYSKQDPRSEPQHRGVDTRLARGPDLVVAIGERPGLLGLLDAHRCARLLDVEAVQVMPIVDYEQRVGGMPGFHAGAVNRHGVTVRAQQVEHPRAARLQVAGIVHDDVEA